MRSGVEEVIAAIVSIFRHLQEILFRFIKKKEHATFALPFKLLNSFWPWEEISFCMPDLRSRKKGGSKVIGADFVFRIYFLSTKIWERRIKLFIPRENQGPVNFSPIDYGGRQPTSRTIINIKLLQYQKSAVQKLFYLFFSIAALSQLESRWTFFLLFFGENGVVIIGRGMRRRRRWRRRKKGRADEISSPFPSPEFCNDHPLLSSPLFPYWYHIMVVGERRRRAAVQDSTISLKRKERSTSCIKFSFH